MARFLIKLGIVCVLVFVTMVSQVSMAQLEQEEQEIQMQSPRKQLATIIFFGLAGAVLGLSTLSFYGRPQDKLSNIPIGFAFGVISGVTYTTYQAATRPYQNYEEESRLLEHRLDDRLAPRRNFANFNLKWDF